MTEWTLVKRHDLFKTPAWNSLEELIKAYPQAYEIGKKWGEDLIANDRLQREWMKANPNRYPQDFRTFDGKHDFTDENGTDWMVIENHIAMGIFNEWFEKTEAYITAEWETQKQIEAYYDALVQNPDRVADARDSVHDNYYQYRLNEKIKEAERRNK